MTWDVENNQFDLVMELLITNGFDGIADAVSILMNTAMQIERSGYLKAEPYEVMEMDLAVPQTRDCDFYPQSLERGLRSERALKLALAVCTGRIDKKMAKITENLCGFEISSPIH